MYFWICLSQCCKYNGKVGMWAAVNDFLSVRIGTMVINRTPFQYKAFTCMEISTIIRHHLIFRMGIPNWLDHYCDIIMATMASQITSTSIVYLTVCSDPDQRKYQSSASLAFVRGIHRWPVNSPHKGPATWKMFPFDDVIMQHEIVHRGVNHRCKDSPVLGLCNKINLIKFSGVLWG